MPTIQQTILLHAKRVKPSVVHATFIQGSDATFELQLSHLLVPIPMCGALKAGQATSSTNGHSLPATGETPLALLQAVSGGRLHIAHNLSTVYSYPPEIMGLVYY